MKKTLCAAMFLAASVILTGCAYDQPSVASLTRRGAEAMEHRQPEQALAAYAQAQKLAAALGQPFDAALLDHARTLCASVGHELLVAAKTEYATDPEHAIRMIARARKLGGNDFGQDGGLVAEADRFMQLVGSPHELRGAMSELGQRVNAVVDHAGDQKVRDPGDVLAASAKVRAILAGITRMDPAKKTEGLAALDALDAAVHTVKNAVPERTPPIELADLSTQTVDIRNGGVAEMSRQYARLVSALAGDLAGNEPGPEPVQVDPPRDASLATMGATPVPTAVAAPAAAARAAIPAPTLPSRAVVTPARVSAAGDEWSDLRRGN